MPRLVSSAELRDLISSREEIARGIDLMRSCLESSHAVDPGQVIFANLALEDSQYAMLFGAAASGQGMSVRVFPGLGNKTTEPDSMVILMFDIASGSLKAIFSGDELNDMRTSMPAGLGAKHLAPPEARTLGILGSGGQAASHALMITTARPDLEEILVWSPTAANRERFASVQSELLGIPVRARETAEEVVRAADVVTAAGRTGAGAAAYEADWVKPGALLISMTGSAPSELAGRARYVVPTRQRPERVAMGFTGAAVPKPVPEQDDALQLLDVVNDGAALRESSEQPVVWELANTYLWDLALLDWAYAWIESNGKGLSFDLTDGAASAT